ERSIAEWFHDGEPPDEGPSVDLAYGENPHQEAWFVGDPHAIGEQLHGRQLSYNNINDLSAARGLLGDLDGPACVIVKHANPCGAAVAASIEEAYEGAVASDPVSAYGGVVAVNRPITDRLGDRLAEQFVEVLSAPAYEPGAL